MGEERGWGRREDGGGEEAKIARGLLSGAVVGQEGCGWVVL
jgi:hypothetical protein